MDSPSRYLSPASPRRTRPRAAEVRAVQLSVVSTLYRSTDTIEVFYQRILAAVSPLVDGWELVLVVDGSPDRDLEMARSLVARDARVRVVDLSRNFGHHRAMVAGLEVARGDLVFLLDSDLEEQPEWFGRFLSVLEEEEADVSFGVQVARKGSVVQRTSGWLFFRIFNALCEHPLPVNVCTVRLMTRRFVEAFLLHSETETIIAGLWVLTGFRQVAVPVSKGDRGHSTYGLGRRLSLLVDAITSFTVGPLVATFYLGALVLTVATLAGGHLVLRKVLFGIAATGWASLIVSVWLLGGLTIFCIGLLGIYLSRVFLETKHRPRYVVRALYEQEDERHRDPRSVLSREVPHSS